MYSKNEHSSSTIQSTKFLYSTSFDTNTQSIHVCIGFILLPVYNNKQVERLNFTLFLTLSNFFFISNLKSHIFLTEKGKSQNNNLQGFCFVF